MTPDAFKADYRLLIIGAVSVSFLLFLGGYLLGLSMERRQADRSAAEASR